MVMFPSLYCRRRCAIVARPRMLASKNAQRVLSSSRVAIVRRVGWNFTDEDQLQVELAGFLENPLLLLTRFEAGPAGSSGSRRNSTTQQADQDQRGCKNEDEFRMGHIYLALLPFG